MKTKTIKFNCAKVNDLFEVVDGMEFIYVEVSGESGCDGIKNSFYGKTHTEETKQLLRESTLTLCKDENFRMSRANFGEKNGMYDSKRFGELNPMYGKQQTKEAKDKIREKAILRYQNGYKNPNIGVKLTDQRKKQIADKNSKTFILKDPHGNVISIKNIEEYSRINDLNPIMIIQDNFFEL